MPEDCSESIEEGYMVDCHSDPLDVLVRGVYGR